MATKKKTGTKTMGGRTPARKKTAGKKAPAGKAPAGRGPARKKTAGKAPAGKAPARKKARLPPAPAQQAGPAENAAAKALAHRIAQLLLDKKADDVVILDVRGMTSYADYFVIASAETDRQVSAMAEHVQVQLKTGDAVLRPIGTEGLETGQWVLLDYGEVVAHLFLTDLRAHYDLEGLWADAAREKVA
jgi:ribosome-associated protein